MRVEIAQEKVRKLAYSFLECAKLNLERDKGLVPAVFLVFPNGEVKIIGCKFDTLGSKIIALNFLSQKAREEGASALIFIGEAWSYKEGDPSRGRVPCASFRGECIAMIVTQRDFPRWAVYQPFVRKKDHILFPKKEEEDMSKFQCPLIPRWER